MKKEINFSAYYSIGFFFLFVIGTLLIYKPAYDYTIAKNMAGFIFCLVLSALYIMERKGIKRFNLSFWLFTIFSFWILVSSFYAPFKYGASPTLENYLLYFMIFIIARSIGIKKEWIFFWIASGFIASIIGIGQYIGPRHYAISTFGNPNFFAGHI
ncbi:hypothetical protein J7L87_02565, partial [bacterium]|nr:hypothetical protein [bacterium]